MRGLRSSSSCSSGSDVASTSWRPRNLTLGCDGPETVVEGVVGVVLRVDKVVDLALRHEVRRAVLGYGHGQKVRARTSVAVRVLVRRDLVVLSREARRVRSERKKESEVETKGAAPPPICRACRRGRPGGRP